MIVLALFNENGQRIGYLRKTRIPTAKETASKLHGKHIALRLSDAQDFDCADDALLVALTLNGVRARPVERMDIKEAARMRLAA